MRAVLLDAHGTLVELRPPGPALRRLMAAEFGLEISVQEANSAIAAEVAYYRAHLQEGRDEASVDELRGRCAEVLREALTAFGYPLAHLSAGELTRVLLAALQFQPYPEVPQVLDELRRRAVRLVVASNWDASLSRTLDDLGLLARFDGVITSAECGAPKPEEEVYRRALEVAAVPAGAALHVGDRPEEDLIGAARMGIRALLVVRDGARPPHGVPAISSLTELLALPELQP